MGKFTRILIDNLNESRPVKIFFLRATCQTSALFNVSKKASAKVALRGGKFCHKKDTFKRVVLILVNGNSKL